MSLPPFVVELAAAAEPATRSRSVVIFAGAALAALLLVVGQLIASRRITRLEEAQERAGQPAAELDARLRQLESAQVGIERLAADLADLRLQASQPTEVPTLLAVLAPLPAEVDRVKTELAEVSVRLHEVTSQLADATAEAPSEPPAGGETVVVERYDRELQEVAARLDALREQAQPEESVVERLDVVASQLAALVPRVARLERLTQRLAQQVASTRETTYFYAGHRPDRAEALLVPPIDSNGDEGSRTAIFVDVFLIPGAALPALADPDEPPDIDYLLVRRTSGVAPTWDEGSPWEAGNGSHPLPFAADVLASFSTVMVNRFFDSEWDRETAFWLTPAPPEVGDLAQRAAGSTGVWQGVIAGKGFEPDADALSLEPASVETLTIIGDELPLPGDPQFVGVKWLVQFLGVAAQDTALASACVKSLPHDLVAEAIAESIRNALDAALVLVGRRQIELPPRPRPRGAALELEQLKADALRTAGS